MKIKLSEGVLEEFLQSFDDGATADEILNEGYFAFSDAELSEVGKYVTAGLSLSDAYRKVLLPLLDEEGKEAYSRVQVGFGLDELSLLIEEDYAKDPYFQAVTHAFSGEKKIGKWTLSMKSYRPYEAFVYDEVRPTEVSPLLRYSPIGAFAKPFRFPALSYQGTTYMSLIPHEMNTMAPAIKRAHGNVVTLGLGMGYFAYMASLKDEVASVTILERDQSVIELFNSFFLPLFPNKEKVKVIRIDDALNYEPEVPFDYAFADLHHDAVDGLPLYLSLLKKEGLAKKMDVWIEEAILTYFCRHVVALIQEEADGYGDEAYQSYEDFSSRVICSLHFHLKNVELNGPEDLEKLLDFANLRKIAAELKLR